MSTVVLLTEWYRPKSDDRFAELKRALEENIDCGLFREIVLFAESSEGLSRTDSKQLRYIERKSRPTFQEFIDFANAYYTEDTIVIANSDISFQLVKHISVEKNEFIVLSRHEFEGGQVVWNDSSHIHMQDGWCFKAPCRLKDAHFFMGRIGCDNRLAWLAHVAKYQVYNKGLEWPIIHYHTSAHRSAQWSNFVPSPYLTVSTSGAREEYWGNRNRFMEVFRSSRMGVFSTMHTLLFCFRYILRKAAVPFGK